MLLKISLLYVSQTNVLHQELVLLIGSPTGGYPDKSPVRLCFGNLDCNCIILSQAAPFKCGLTYLNPTPN